MKLVWSPETASKAYIDTVKSCELSPESGEAELISAMAAGWNAKLIVEAHSSAAAAAATATSTTVGLSIAAAHSGGRHVIILPNSADVTSTSPNIIIGDPEEAMSQLEDIDFFIFNGRRRDFARFLRCARLSSRGAVLVFKNECKTASCGGGFRWRELVEGGDYKVVRTAFLPVGNGLDIAHVGAAGGSHSNGSKKRWIKHFDQSSGEEHLIRVK